ncbi:MAG TPA: hypothetical protein PLH57_00165 [Oligoflexia bacterium]|nr:hypothetical protein [Oligoflexia bacterium]
MIIFILGTNLAFAQNRKAPPSKFQPIQESVTSDGGTRANHFSGFDFALGQPVPSYGGLMIGFHVHDDARLSLAIGEAGQWMTYALDTKIFLSPESVAMYVGGGLSYMNGSEGKFLFWDLQFSNGLIPYIQGGVDWVNEEGFHLGANLGVTVPNGEVVVLPGVAIGWYF